MAFDYADAIDYDDSVAYSTAPSYTLGPIAGTVSGTTITGAVG
jgi:hypothetical protein